MFPSFEYIKSYLGKRLFDYEFSFKFDDKLNLSMRLDDSAKFITFPPFLSGFEHAALLKDQPLELRMVPVDDFIKNILDETEIPILCEQNMLVPARLISLEENFVCINFDLLGTIFYILARMEEIKNHVRDEHDRFPASASHAFQNGYLHRPVVDELLEVLWACIKYCWPSVQRKKTFFRTVLTHDIDIPFAEAFSDLGRVLRYCAGDVIKRKEFSRALKRIRNLVSVRRGDFRKDTNYTFDRIMSISEKHGLKSAFYFKTDCTNGKFDIPYPIEHPFLRELLRDIHNRGHEIGLHPSYETYRNPEQTRKEFEKLLQVCTEEGIDQEKWGGRQHYLRWEAPTTWRNWNEAGLNYDSSVCFAEHVGFRCGTCHEFPVFDIEKEKELHLKERPLLLMETSLFASCYMNLSHEEILNYANIIKNKCIKYKGNFTLLWHNNSFLSEKNILLYEEMIK